MSSAYCMWRFIVVIYVLSVHGELACGVAPTSNAVFLQEPENQYILEGTSASISCTATEAQEAYWIINGFALTLSHCCQEKSHYEAMGVVFMEVVGSTILPTFHLSMTVPACASSLVKNIYCAATDVYSRRTNTSAVNVFVFKTLRPHAPNLTVNVDYHASTLPHMIVTMIGQPLWPTYEMSEFILNITNSSDGSLINQWMVPNNVSENNSAVLIVDPASLFDSTTYHCYSLRVSASAVSSLYGESEVAQMEAPMFRVPGSFSEQGVHHKSLFTSNGSLSHVSLQLQLPDVCSNQPINYTIKITKEDGEGAGNIVFSRPYAHTGSGVVSIDLRDLKKDHMYSVRVRVDSLTGSTESSYYHFNTAAEFDTCFGQSFNAVTVPSTSTNVSSYKVTMGISLAIAVLMLIAFTVLLLCFCIRHRRKRAQYNGDHSTGRVFNGMVSNPIYAGPVYDIVQPQFDKAPQPYAMPTPLNPSHNNRSMDTNHRNNDEENQLPHSKRSVLSSNFYSSDIVGGSTTRISSSVWTTGIKSNGQERNKLRLTLPSEGGKDLCMHSCEQDVPDVKAEETYVEMRNTGTLSSPCKKDTLV